MSPLITQVGPQGIAIGNTQVPQLNIGLQVNPIDISPALQANAATMEKLQFEEQQYQFQEQLKLRLMAEQRALFDQGQSSRRQGRQVANNNYGLRPDQYAKDALIADGINSRTNEVNTQIYGALANTNARGRVDSGFFLKEADRLQRGLQTEINNDVNYRETIRANIERDRFDQQIQEARQSGKQIDFTEANRRIAQFDQFKNDLSGSLQYNPSLFNTDDIVYDERRANDAMTTILDDAAFNSEITEFVRLGTLNPDEFRGDGTLVQVKKTQQQALADAQNKAIAAIRADHNAMIALRANGTSPEEFVNTFLNNRIRDEEARITEAKIIAQTTGGRGRTGSSRSSRGGGSGSNNLSDLEEEKLRLFNDLKGLDIERKQFAVTPSQIDEIFRKVNDKDFKEDADGNPNPFFGLDPRAITNIDEGGNVYLQAPDGTRFDMGKAGSYQAAFGRPGIPEGTVPFEAGQQILEVTAQESPLAARLTQDGSVGTLLAEISKAEGTTDEKARDNGFNS